ncbi:MAG: DUF167 family protein [Sedimenticola sp.]|nr:DUF167 family protein [Sedimenticola sp.]
MGNTWYQWEGKSLILNLRVQPNAGRDAFVGPYGEQYKIRITAPPVEGKANKHLVRLLAKAFGVTRNQVTLIHGETSKNKGFRIDNPEKYPIPLTKPTKK